MSASPGLSPSAKRARLTRKEQVGFDAVDVVGEAEAIRADDRETALARDARDVRLRVARAGSRRTRPRRSAPSGRCAARSAAIASRTPAAGSAKTARSTPSGNSSALCSIGRPSIGSVLRPTRWMSPANSLSLQRLENDLADACRRAPTSRRSPPISAAGSARRRRVRARRRNGRSFGPLHARRGLVEEFVRRARSIRRCACIRRPCARSRGRRRTTGLASAAGCW